MAVPQDAFFDAAAGDPLGHLAGVAAVEGEEIGGAEVGGQLHGGRVRWGLSRFVAGRADEFAPGRFSRPCGR